MRFKTIFYLLIVITTLTFCCCEKDIPISGYRTQNVILIVVDGARYSETWGNQQLIPYRSALLSEGVMCNNFHNNGTTSTVPGHTAMCTGTYQNINNGGAEYPAEPSFFQYWLKIFKRSLSKAWIISTKDKLAVLSDCLNPEWHNTYNPSLDCGNAGLGTGYREDSTTFKNVKSTLTNYHPNLILVNFKQPDVAAHAGDSAGYIQGIRDTDNYIYSIWNYLQNDTIYKNKTTLIVTNDHGRHTAGYADGYVSHGDNCEGCKHIEFFAIGPDFKKNFVCTTSYEQIDIASTIAELMGFTMPTANGKVMKDIFSNK